MSRIAERSIPRVLLLGMISVSAAALLVVGGLWIGDRFLRFAHETRDVVEQNLAENKALVRNQVDSALSYIQYMRSQIEERTRGTIKARVQEAVALALRLHATYGSSHTLTQIGVMVREALRDIRWGGGRGYYFATRLDGVEQLFADRPELEGMDLSGIADSRGALVVSDMIAIARSEGEGFYSYRWTKPGTPGDDHLKISYVKLVEPLGWIIGTGEYLEDMALEIQTEVLDRLGKVRFGGEDYVFAGRWDGVSLVGPAVGENMIDVTDVNGLKVVRELIRTAREGGGFVRYVVPRETGLRTAEKLSYVRPVEDWQWYVGAGVYLDTAELAAGTRLDALLDQVLLTAGLIAAMLAALFGVSYVVALRISRGMGAAFGRFRVFFQEAERSPSPDHPVSPMPTEGLGYREFRDLALAMNRMIEARRAAEAEAKRLEERMRNAQKLESLGLLAGGIAHDFNNILTVILGNATLARGETQAHPGLSSRLDTILEATRRAAELSQQMLAYAGRAPLRREEIDLSDLVRGMGELLTVSLPKKVRLSFVLSQAPLPVRVDATQIRQVVLNLLTNAAEAIGEAEGHVTVTTAAAGADGIATLEVADDGTGMDPETQDRIFDPFFSTKFTGRGLGLAAVQGIVHGHGGSIQVHSVKGQGTRFAVRLPIDPASSMSPRPEAPGLPREPGARRGYTGRVLVVDDEPGVRRLVRAVIERMGFEVIEATDGVEALAAARALSGPPRLAVLDMTMPRMDGRETLRELRARTPGLAVILASGYDEREVHGGGEADGVTAFLHKPFLPEELEERVVSLLG